MKLYVAVILAISFLDLFNEGIVRGSFGSQTMPWNQCISLHTGKINIRKISSYEEQERPFKAVIFITNDGIRICMPHDHQHVQGYIKILKQRTKTNKPVKGKPSPRSRATRSTARTS